MVITHETDGSVQIRIVDNGPGISDDQNDSIFGKTEKGLERPGTDLGRYLPRSVVERYGGNVWFEDRLEGTSSEEASSNEGVDSEDEVISGAVFVAELPMADSHSSEQ